VWQVIHYFLFVASQRKGVPTDRTRHYRVWWYPLEALPPIFWPEQRQLLEQHRETMIQEVRCTREA